DAVMSLPALHEIRRIFRQADIAVVARPSVAGLYAREKYIDRVIAYPKGERAQIVKRLRAEHFDCAILLQNAFDAAWIAWRAGIPERIGSRRDGRGFLLTRAIPVPEPGETPRHERYYYLELLRRIGWIERFPDCSEIRLHGVDTAREAGTAQLGAMGVTGPVIGISPGAAYGNAKRWLPERFAEVARDFLPASVLLFGSSPERELCQSVADAVPGARNLAGE